MRNNVFLRNIFKQFVCIRTAGAPARGTLNLSQSQIFDFDSGFGNFFADVYKQSSETVQIGFVYVVCNGWLESGYGVKF